MLLAQGLRLFLQAFYFIIIAKALGPQQYGAFVGTTSLVSILAPFAALGTGNLLIKNVSRDRSLFSDYWGNALFMTLISGSILGVCLLLISPLFLPPSISIQMVLLAAIADLIFFRFLDIAGQAFGAVLWLRQTALLSTLPNITRVIAALLLVHYFSHPTATQWMAFYLASTALPALLGLWMVHQQLGKPKLAIHRIQPEILEGCYFSIGLSSQTIYNDIDKTMLARLSTLEATGIYAAAYRLIDVAFVPVRSLLVAAYAKFFQKGAFGIQGSLTLARKLIPIAGIYALGSSLALFFLAPLIPLVLGQDYSGAVLALQWLAPLPMLKTLHYFAADTLTGAGFQGYRSAVQAGIAILNVLLNLWFIPRYSWQGAAGVSLVSDGLLMVALWVLVWIIYRDQQLKLRES
jgi:O-antigen/teichoic acid export membrane protein